VYAVISDRSRQHTVRSGDLILCDFAGGKSAGETITFDQVLLVGGEGTARVGKPFVEGASVVGEVVGTSHGEKLVVFRFKRRKNVRRKKGHRQDYTQVRITEIRA
jgi:large subunit ribosomal protein L21